MFWTVPGVALAQQVRARVVDEPSRSALPGVSVALLSADSREVARGVTGPNGFFTLSAPTPGTYLVQVRSLGYVAETRSVELVGGESVIPAFVLRASVIPMDTLAVEVDPSEVTSQGVVGFSRPSHLLAGERMATLERAGVSIASAVRGIGGVRVRDVKRGDRHFTCFESSRALYRGSRCQMVVIVVDGISIGRDDDAALLFVHSLHLYDFESIEYVSPVDAGTRYGLRASDRGALVLWHRGMGPHKTAARGPGISPAVVEKRIRILEGRDG